MATGAAVLDARAPPVLRQLLALFSSLEFSLSSLALYQRTADWAAVKLAVESSSQQTLTKEHMQQMLWLAPAAFSVTWSRRPPSRKRARAANSDADDRDPDEPVMLLRRQRLTPVPEPKESTKDNIPNPSVQAETLTERIEWFTKRLNEFIEEHVAKITASQLSLDEEDEVASALASVEIRLAPLPEMDLVCGEQLAHQRLKEIAKKTEQAVTSSELQAALAAPVPEDLQTLPKWLIDRVRRQEQQGKKASKRTDAALKHRLYATLPQLSDQIQSLVLVLRKNVFPLKEMARQLLTKAPIRDQVEEQIQLLESMVPFWITVFYCDGQEFVKVSKAHKYNTVKSALRKAIATMA